MLGRKRHNAKQAKRYGLPFGSQKVGRTFWNKGQATIELALALPFLIWLIFYTLNAFHSMHTAHVAQKYAAMSLYDRVGNRAKFVVDDREGQLHGKEFMAVQYLSENGNLPERKILFGPIRINAVVGICREPACR